MPGKRSVNFPFSLNLDLPPVAYRGGKLPLCLGHAGRGGEGRLMSGLGKKIVVSNCGGVARTKWDEWGDAG